MEYHMNLIYQFVIGFFVICAYYRLPS